MKKTLLSLLIVAATLNVGHAEVSIHGTDFSDFKNGAHDEAKGKAAYYQVTGYTNSKGEFVNGNYIGGGARTYGGFYIDNGLGVKFNHSGNITVANLYLGSEVALSASNDDASANIINWNNDTNNQTITIQGNDTHAAWLDIDNVCNTRIKVGSMAGGTVYLNKHGKLEQDSGTLANSNTVVADVNLDLEDVARGTYTREFIGDNVFLVTRTLLAGDYAGWTGTVILSDGTETIENGLAVPGTWGKVATGEVLAAMESGDYTSLSADNIGAYRVIADATGLKIAYVMPEPTTATLSLLALAALAARRRRK